MDPSPLNERKAAAWLRLPAIVAVVAVMILISIPLVRQTRHEQWRRQAIRELMLIEEAKTAYALDYNLRPSDRVEIEALLRHGKYLTQPPTMPRRAPYDIGAIGEQPSCQLLGQRIVPITTGPAAARMP